MSGGEIALAQAAEFPLERAYFHGNNKSKAELREAMEAGVGRVIVDNFSDIALLNEVALSMGRRLRGGSLCFATCLRSLVIERTPPALIRCTSTRIICRRGCPHEQRLGEVNRVVFASVADAVSVGYRPCRVCRPSPAA